MSRRRPRSPLPRRRLRRESDGSLYDVDERRRIELAELCDDVRAGRYFRAARHTSGEDCTQEVLAQVLSAGVPNARMGGAGLGSMVANLLGAIVSGAASGRDVTTGFGDKEQTAPKGRGARSTRHEWWEGD